MHRAASLIPGRMGYWVWSRDDEEIARIGYSAKEGRLVLNYRVQQYVGEGETISQTIG